MKQFSVDQIAIMGRPIANMWSIRDASKNRIGICEYQGNRLVLIRGSITWKMLHQQFGITREAVEAAIKELN